MNLPERIIYYRAKHNLTQKEFAKRCNISLYTVYFIEKGTQKPKAKVLGKILSVINEEE